MESHPMLVRQIVILLILTLLTPQFGCMTKPPPMDLHDKLLSQRIALVSDRSNVLLSLDLFAKSKPQGALKGAGQGIAALLQGGGGGSCSGEMCGAVLLLYLTFAVVVGGTLGAIHGTIAATSTKQTSAIEGLMTKHFGDFARHLNLAQKVFSRGSKISGLALDLVPLSSDEPDVSERELRQLKKVGYEKVLTIKIENIAFAGDEGDDPSLGLAIEASTGILDTGSQAEVYHSKFHSLGKVRRYSEWLKMDSAAISAELDDALEDLAEDIVTSLFLSYDLPIDSGSWAFPGTQNYGCCWICPISPPLEIVYFPRVEQGWPYLPSRHSQLAWQPFPDERGQAQLQEDIGCRATHVLYDLRVWEMAGNLRGNLVYERHALPSTTHRLEDPLHPGMSYLWSIRACFNLEARVACTPWAFSLVPAEIDACKSTIIGPENYYHFIAR